MLSSIGYFMWRIFYRQAFTPPSLAKLSDKIWALRRSPSFMSLPPPPEFGLEKRLSPYNTKFYSQVNLLQKIPLTATVKPRKKQERRFPA
jgi:hypothetical protein